MHTKVMQDLVEGKTFNIKGYSHVVCVRQDKKESWIEKGYEVIGESADAVMVGKKKKVKLEKEAQTTDV